MSVRHGLIALWWVLAVGCAQVTTGPPEDAIQTAEPAAAAITPLAADETANPEPPFPVPVPTVSDTTENSIDDAPVATESAPSTASVADIALEASEPIGTLEASAIQELEPAPAPIPDPVASPVFGETLDFSSLVSRLRKTKAISLRTKVAVKNESDDLLEQFRAYHTQNGMTTLAELRRSYDLLFHKLHSLLEDADPPLARDIDQSQAAIWELLADPRKFSASDLIAGA